jgi:O-antigen ligase
VLIDETVAGDQTTGTPDGRPCQTHTECYAGDAEPGGHYMCERVGLFGTTSISDGRVRYRGVLQDPNELALAASIGIPLAFVLAWRRRRLSRWTTALSILALVLLCTILTRSRGGQLVFLMVLAAYFVNRFGMRGVVVGGIIGLPVLLLGGRSGLEASASTMERIEAWYEAISMIRSNPPLGVGFRQFHEYHYLTAHNSYLLTSAELGLPGLLLFTAIMFVSAKIPLTVLHRYAVSPPGFLGRLSGMLVQAGPPVPGERLQQAEVARKWALALLAALSGLGIGIFFLSFAYHYILWIYIGLSGALYSAVKLHDPAFEVRFGLRDLLLVAAFDAILLLGMFAYTRLMLG